MHAQIDEERCNGCSICQIICPEVFSVMDDGREQKARAYSEPVPEEAERFCVDARDCCKQRAIHLHEESVSDGGRRARAAASSSL